MKESLFTIASIYILAALLTWSNTHLFSTESILSLIIIWVLFAMIITSVVLFVASHLVHDNIEHDFETDHRTHRHA